jgi:hypothetical protein
MGAFPCLRCSQRFKGEAQNAYLTFYDGDERESYRFVVCEPCLEELLHEWRCRALFRNTDGDWEAGDPSDVPVPKRAPSEPREVPLKRRRDR